MIWTFTYKVTFENLHGIVNYVNGFDILPLTSKLTMQGKYVIKNVETTYLFVVDSHT